MAKKQKKSEPTLNIEETKKFQSPKKGAIKSWAITWLLAIFAAEWGLLPQPLSAQDGLPVWVPLLISILRFLVLWFSAYVITKIIFGAWEILNEYYHTLK
ncbi:hypothetical protein B1757_05355 [Acidithiobacillus marinus]|uniref:Uncharacterized protein n=1 Tax=Acidithiobacillus marinus TaxID=187490 RepID=A0A2I1DMW0_9PROT|nr:hypothetical protein [Acidithiobacillus marinus]PKY11216.1 hypothetical protein B1757_05355 [Acidithiobacillus marinus]